MMREEIQERLAKECARGEAPRDDTQSSKYTTNAVWVFLILEMVLTLLVGYGLWAKAGGITPFFWTSNASPLKNSPSHAR